MAKYQLHEIDKHKILQVMLNNDPGVIEKAEHIASMKTRYIESHDPSGRIRDQKEIYSQNFLGAIADIASTILFNDYFKKHEMDILAVSYDDVRIDEFTQHDQFDIRLIRNNKHFHVEVRSSICLFLSVPNVVKKWQILGPYSTKIKGIFEKDRDFYIRPIFHLRNFRKNIKTQSYNRKVGVDLFKKGEIDLYFVGGATFDLLQSPLGRNEAGQELKQSKAEYRVINILDGYDIEEFLNIVSKTILLDSSIPI